MNPVVRALIFGLISAVSLPLGALTATVWQPRDRAIALLMAFGGGALLSALALDLVGSAVERGHFLELAVGAILGSLLYMSLNSLVNERGGFLRKPSTTYAHLKRKAQTRFQQAIADVGRIDLFAKLSPDEQQELIAAVELRSYPRGAMIYRDGDPSDELYVLETGAADILSPEDNRVLRHLVPNEAFGRMGFLTELPRANLALAVEAVQVWAIPRAPFQALLQKSPALRRAVREFLETPKAAAYLQERQHIPPEHIPECIELAVQGIARDRSETAVAVELLGRLPGMRELLPVELEAIATRLLRQTREDGFAYFLQGEWSERLFLLEAGQVALFDPTNPSHKPEIVPPGELFGLLSFLTGATHTVSAIGKGETTVWALRRQDFEDLMREYPGFQRAMKERLQQADIAAYLERKKQFEPSRAAQWVGTALDRMEVAGSIPQAIETEATADHSGAPLAIWLGILLDGIPESLALGASVLQTGVSGSLVAGLFLSNYPEALSSSVGMRQQGMTWSRVLSMWTSLMVITGIGAAIGSVMFEVVPPELFASIEGIAAGSMLTMIAETMLPEAHLKGGSIGFATLLGFLVAIAFAVE